MKAKTQFQKAIDFLAAKNIRINIGGVITSKLPSGQKGLSLVNDLEDATMSEDHCYTIINSKLEKIDC